MADSGDQQQDSREIISGNSFLVDSVLGIQIDDPDIKGNSLDVEK